MSDEVVLKGSRFGVKMVFDETADFKLVLQKLQRKLMDAKGFFGKGTTFLVDEAIDPKEREALRSLLDEFGMKLDVKTAKKKIHSEPKQEEPAVMDDGAQAEEKLKIIQSTVRGGQEIEWDGSIVIFGNVNPGAKIVAGGNIIVKGTCRGIVHAGAYGNREATIIADKMMAGQIRIADVIACAPDKLEPAKETECARIRENHIIIEPVERREVS